MPSCTSFIKYCVNIVLYFLEKLSRTMRNKNFRNEQNLHFDAVDIFSSFTVKRNYFYDISVVEKMESEFDHFTF